MPVVQKVPCQALRGPQQESDTVLQHALGSEMLYYELNDYQRSAFWEEEAEIEMFQASRVQGRHFSFPISVAFSGFYGGRGASWGKS